MIEKINCPDCGRDIKMRHVEARRFQGSRCIITGTCVHCGCVVTDICPDFGKDKAHQYDHTVWIKQ